MLSSPSGEALEAHDGEQPGRGRNVACHTAGLAAKGHEERRAIRPPA